MWKTHYSCYFFLLINWYRKKLLILNKKINLITKLKVSFKYLVFLSQLCEKNMTVYILLCMYKHNIFKCTVVGNQNLRNMQKITHRSGTYLQYYWFKVSTIIFCLIHIFNTLYIDPSMMTSIEWGFTTMPSLAPFDYIYMYDVVL